LITTRPKSAVIICGDFKTDFSPIPFFKSTINNSSFTFRRKFKGEIRESMIGNFLIRVPVLKKT